LPARAAFVALRRAHLRLKAHVASADACKFMLELKRILEDWDQEIG